MEPVKKSENYLKNIYVLSKEFNSEISFLKRNNTYLYILQDKVNLSDVLSTQREFNEIFFHGKQQLEGVNKILEKFGGKLKVLSFCKNDLTFLKVPATETLIWLNFSQNLTHLNTANIQLIKSTNEIVKLNFLKKLRCGDSMLALIQAPNLEKLRVFTTEQILPSTLQEMNNFFKRHFEIKYFAYTIYNGEDTDTQDCAFELSHLKLKNLRLMEFRFDIPAVMRILEHQPDLIELRLEDGSYSDTNDDLIRIANLNPLFSSILELKKLEKLYIEMPSVEIMENIPNRLVNLKVLKLCSITKEMLDTFKMIPNHNVTKLCIENLDHGKDHLKIDHIRDLARSYPNLNSFKTETLPPTVLNSISMYMTKLKKLKIIRNEYLPQKKKRAFSESVACRQESSLERITFRYEDYKLRILPLIQVAPKLKYAKIYWDNKNTPFMQIIFEIIMACPRIELFDFCFDGVYIKANVISFSKSFYFSYNDKNYELTINRKKGKIICKKLT